MKSSLRNLNYFLSVIDERVCKENMKVNLECPGSTIHLFSGKISKHLHRKDIQKLCDRLVSGKCAQGIDVNLSRNSLKNRNIYIIADMLKHANRPKNIKLDLSINLLTDKGAIALLNALRDGPDTSGVTINLSGLCVENPLGVNFSGNTITDKTALHFARLISTQSLPDDVSIDFSSTKITQNGVLAIVRALEQTIRNNRYPKGLSILLDNVRMDENLRSRLSDILNQKICSSSYSAKESVVFNNPVSFYRSNNEKRGKDNHKACEAQNSPRLC